MIYKRMWNDTFIGLGPKSRVTLVNTYQMYHYTLLKNVNDDIILYISVAYEIIYL